MRPNSANDTAKKRYWRVAERRRTGPTRMAAKRVAVPPDYRRAMLVPAFSRALVIVHSGPANDRLR